MNIVYLCILILALNSIAHGFPAKLESNNAEKPLEAPSGEKLLNSVQTNEAQITNEEETSRRPKKGCLADEQESTNFVGSNLFDTHIVKCFLPNDVALLTMRRDFEMLIPKDINFSEITDQTVGDIMLYFYICHRELQQMEDHLTQELGIRSFYDILGGYLRFYLIPAVKQGYYRGRISLETAQNILLLYQQCKITLNTAGNGWKKKKTFKDLKHMKIAPLQLCAQRGQPSCCTDLDLLTCNEVDNDEVIVAMPKLEPEDKHGFLGNIWFPLKRKHIFNLRSVQSAYVFVNFYQKVTGCYEFQAISQTTFNLKVMNWISEYIESHLNDEEFYPGLGSILSVNDYVKRPRPKKDVEAVENSLDNSVENPQENAVLKKLLTPLIDYGEKRGCGERKKKKKKFGSCNPKSKNPKKTFAILTDKDAQPPPAKKGEKPSEGGGGGGGSVSHGVAKGGAKGGAKGDAKGSAKVSPSKAPSGESSGFCVRFIIYGFIVIGIIMLLLWLARRYLKKRKIKVNARFWKAIKRKISKCCRKFFKKHAKKMAKSERSECSSILAKHPKKKCIPLGAKVEKKGKKGKVEGSSRRSRSKKRSGKKSRKSSRSSRKSSKRRSKKSRKK